MRPRARLLVAGEVLRAGHDHGRVREGSVLEAVKVTVAPQTLEINATITSEAALAFTIKKVKGQWVLE